MWQFPVDCFPLWKTADQNFNFSREAVASQFSHQSFISGQLGPYGLQNVLVSKLYQNRKVTKLKTNMATREAKKKGHGVQLYLMLFWQTFWSDIMFREPKTIKNSWKTRPKNASGITTREMLLNGSESFAFVQGKSLWNHLELRNIPQVNGMCWYLVVQYLAFRILFLYGQHSNRITWKTQRLELENSESSACLLDFTDC